MRAALHVLTVSLVAFCLVSCRDTDPLSPAARPKPTAAKTQRSAFVDESAIALVSIEARSQRSETTLLYDIYLDGGASDESLSLPANDAYDIVVRGYDATGQQTHSATLSTPYISIGKNEPLRADLAPEGEARPSGFAIDLVGQEPINTRGYQLAIEGPTQLNDGDIGKYVASLTIDGVRQPLDPTQFHWAIQDPRGGRLQPDRSGAELLIAQPPAGGTTTQVVVNYGSLSAWFKIYLKKNVWVDVSAGQLVSCALKYFGDVYCWGDNTGGMLGVGLNGTTELCTSSVGTSTNQYPCSTRPLLVTGGHSFRAVSVGWEHVCAIETGTNAAYCWGDDGVGQLGFVLTNQVTSSPIAFEPSTPVPSRVFSSISAGYAHTCGVTTSQQVYCWGMNGYGQLGDGTTTPSTTPVLAQGGTLFKSVSAGYLFSCGVTTSGNTVCWGKQPLSGTVGYPAGWQLLGTATTARHVCGISNSGQSYCWGDNGSGQVGKSSSTMPIAQYPQLLSNFSFSVVTTGEAHSCALSGTDAYCWGHNYFGELGTTGANPLYLPQKVVAGFGGPTLSFSTISAGAMHTCGLSAGALVCWGRNDFGQVGVGRSSFSAGPAVVVDP